MEDCSAPSGPKRFIAEPRARMMDRLFVYGTLRGFIPPPILVCLDTGD